MGTLNAIYIRASDPTIIGAVRSLHPAAYTEPLTTFIAIDRARENFRCPEQELQSLSDRLKTDVIWLTFQSAVDAFQYHHWSNGRHLRSLIYGCFDREREWERAEGAPQVWEAEVIFGSSRLKRVLRCLDSEEERLQVKQIYRDKKIMAGNAEPWLDARETARGVAEFYRFPGWSIAISGAR